MTKSIGNIENASPRPWRIAETAWTNRRGLKPGALILAANDETVAVCHPDNAALIVKAANALDAGFAAAEVERLRGELMKANRRIYDLEFPNNGGGK